MSLPMPRWRGSHYALPKVAVLMTWSLAAAWALPVRGADPGIEFFEKKIRPVLAEHCYPCHSADLRKQKAKLALDSRDAARKGGESGPALVPGKPNESLLLKAVRYTDEDLKMPPKGKLPAAVIADMEKWIAMGTPDPRAPSPLPLSPAPTRCRVGSCR